MSDRLQAQNSRLNNEEYQLKKIELKSYPQAVFVQMAGPCNHNCLFCSRPDIYEYFDLNNFLKNFEHMLLPVFQRVNRINLTGSGELLFLPEAKRNLSYFNQFENAEKMFATNGSSLTPKMVDFIIESENRYLIHVSLHSSNAGIHRTMTKANNHQIVMENLKYINKARKTTDNLRLNLIFVATSRNIKDLINFIKLAYEVGVDGVVVYYHYIYRMDQKDISCYFNQEETNNMLDLAEAESLRLCEQYDRKIELSLPPGFGKSYDVDNSLCNEAWSQIMINCHGDIISCDVAGDSFENIKGKKDFMEVWNGKYYIDLRRNLIEKKIDCSRFCFRVNQNRVNDFKSHVITRGKSQEEIEEFLK